MSDFKFSCPACGQHIVCDTGNVGMNIACPACHTALTVPSAPPVAMAEPAPIPPPASGPNRQKFAGLAIASFICSLVPCAGWLPGIICGHLARRGLRRDASLKGGGFALAGLIISYFSVLFTITMLAVGMSTFIRDFKAAFAQAEQEAKSHPAHAPGHASADNSSPKTTPGETLWSLNLTTAEIPDQPAAGKIHGEDFAVEAVRVQNNNIILRQRQSGAADCQVSIFTFVKKGEALAGRTFEISPAEPDSSGGPMPQIHVSWKEAGSSTNQTKVYRTGYALKLELGAAEPDGKIPAKIYLCLPDDEKSYVAGTFDIETKKAPGKGKKPKKPATN